MVKQNSKNKINETKKDKVFDPLRTWWGKALIWGLSILMIAGIIISFIIALPNA